MDVNWAIEKNRDALKRILAMLVAMAGLEAWLRGQFAIVPRKGAAHRASAQEEKSKLPPALNLPRRVHCAVLRLLRPAESAARRLIIVMACYGPQVRNETAPPRARTPPRYVNSVITTHAGVMTRMVWLPGATFPKLISLPPGPAVTRLGFPLFDPLRNLFRPRRQTVPAHAAPRILSFDGSRPHTLPPPPSPNDLIDVTRLGLRLQALGRALNDLPGQARRFARWKARRDALVAQGVDRTSGAQRFRRIWPLRTGRPPGGRLSSFDPDSAPRRNVREVDEVLAHAHALAVYALERRDTS